MGGIRGETVSYCPQLQMVCSVTVQLSSCLCQVLNMNEMVCVCVCVLARVSVCGGGWWVRVSVWMWVLIIITTNNIECLPSLQSTVLPLPTVLNGLMMNGVLGLVFRQLQDQLLPLFETVDAPNCRVIGLQYVHVQLSSL